MLTIFKRDFLAYFRTPVGYVFLGVFAALTGVIFYLGNLATLSGELLIFLSQLTMLIMLLTPVLTMRLLCEDRQRRTDQRQAFCPDQPHQQDRQPRQLQRPFRADRRV